MNDTASSNFLVKAGVVGLIAGVAGPVLAAGMIFVPPQVAPGPLHYPFSSSNFLIAQFVFFLHHWGMVIPLVALAISGAVGPAKYARGGAWLAVAGMLGLTFAELNTMRFGHLDAATANEGFVGAVYGISCNSIGLGLILAGIGTARAGFWSGWRRWVPLVIGIATFVELTPGMFGGYLVARMAIGFWIGLFGVLGQCLRVEYGQWLGQGGA